jgi:hypothetical protein
LKNFGDDGEKKFNVRCHQVFVANKFEPFLDLLPPSVDLAGDTNEAAVDQVMLFKVLADFFSSASFMFRQQ